jgi:RecJ-like exonuclease
METRTLLKLSLVVALVSTFIIVILANNLEPETKSIETINEKSLDEWIKIQGTVTQETAIETLKIITVNDGTASINCIFRQKSDSFKDKQVEILGKIIDYKGELEIEISKIRTL